MHTNDTHAHLDNVAKRVTAVTAVREEKPNAVLVDAGDVFSGTLYFNEYKGQADVQFMNLMQYDLMTFGNHEFDLGDTADGNTALADFVSEAHFPFVSSNVDFSNDTAMKALQNNTITSDPDNGQIYNAVIKEIDGEKVGFFGLTTEETKDIASPGSTTFADYIESAEQTVTALEEQDIDKIIAVTHIGYNDNALYDNDVTLAAEVDGIDVIVGGHDHTKLSEPVLITKDSEGNEKDPTIIVQAYQYSEFLGTVDVEFDENGVVAGYAGQLIDVSAQTEDAEAAEMLKEYADTIEALKSEETGATTEKELTNPRISDEGNTNQYSVRKNETELGNLITNSMLWAAKQKDKNVVIAMQNGGGIRSSINAGPITVGEVMTVLPFGNTLATMQLTGTEIIKALEHSVSAFPQENGGFLHVAGMKYTFDSSKEVGSRIQSVQVQDGNNDSYTTLDNNKTYTVATNYFTAKGGDGYTVFAEAFADNRVTDYGQSDWETFKNYLQQVEKVNPTIEGRIVDIVDSNDNTNNGDDSDNGEGFNIASNKGNKPLTISQIQGASHTSPYVGKEVTGVTGIVTSVKNSSTFYIQSLKPDKDKNTSEGLMVFMRSHDVNVGDVVAVDGTIAEYAPSNRTNDLTSTQITGTNVVITASNQALPKPVVLDDDRKMPTKVIDKDSFKKFNPNRDGIDYFESLEGMLVEVQNPTIIAPQAYGDLWVVPETIKPTNAFSGLNISSKDYNPERINLDLNDYSIEANAGDKINGNAKGVVSYDFGNYVVQLKSSELPPILSSSKAASEDTTTIVKDNNKLSVATYNIENFSVGDQRTNDIAKTIVDNLDAPDIIQLSEVQDDSGTKNDGVTSATQSYKAITDAIQTLGGPTYAYTEIAPENNQDGGAPGANIRVGMLYNTERVKLSEGTMGAATESVAYQDGNLTVNPGRIDPTNEAFLESRKPLAAQFDFQGEQVIVIANHYNSKGGDLQLFGNIQPATLSSEVQRNEIATVVNSFVKNILADNKDANIVVLGDFNDFEFSNPLKITAGKELTNMINKVPTKDRFTYFYQGNSQVLDHILVSKNLASSTEVDIVHINSPFYNQISDHDPVLIQTEL